jgi:hypothetical protein
MLPVSINVAARGRETLEYGMPDSMQAGAGAATGGEPDDSEITPVQTHRRSAAVSTHLEICNSRRE